MIYKIYHMKSVVFVWTQSCVNLENTDQDNFWGINDVVRGMLATYELCRQHEYPFYIDLQLHPISQFIENPVHPYMDAVYANRNNILFLGRDEIESFLLSPEPETDNKVYYFMTNMDYDDATCLSRESKDAIYELFQNTKPDFRAYYNKILDEFHFHSEPFSVLHFRLGDNGIVRRDEKDVHYLNYIRSIFDEHTKPNQLLLSDNKKWKEFLKTNYRDKVTIYHTRENGSMGHYKEDEAIRNTLVEFLLISNATAIKTYSIYSWASGLITIPSILRDVPIESLR